MKELVGDVEGRRKDEYGSCVDTETGVAGHKLRKLGRRCDWYTWSYALMEMLVDPVLKTWVPAWVVEQYTRWNPYFEKQLRTVMEVDADKALSNRTFLRTVRKKMESDYRRKKLKEKVTEEELADSDSGAENQSHGSSAGSGDSDNACDDPEKAVKKAWHHDDDEDGASGGDLEAGALADKWAQLSLDQQLSAAAPAPAIGNRVLFAGECAGGGIGVLGPDSRVPASVSNFVDPSKMAGMKEQWALWRTKSVRGHVEAVLRGDLDDEGQGFFADILEHKAEERERLSREGKLECMRPCACFSRVRRGRGSRRQCELVRMRDNSAVCPMAV